MGLMPLKEFVDMAKDRRCKKLIRKALNKIDKLITDLSKEYLESEDCLKGDCVVEIVLWLRNPNKNTSLVSAAFRHIVEGVEKEVRKLSKGQQDEANCIMAGVVEEMVRTVLYPLYIKMMEKDSKEGG
jgi:uncharacterized protein YcbK (DUF882 family)